MYSKRLDIRMLKDICRHVDIGDFSHTSSENLISVFNRQSANRVSCFETHFIGSGPPKNDFISFDAGISDLRRADNTYIAVLNDVYFDTRSGLIFNEEFILLDSMFGNDPLDNKSVEDFNLGMSYAVGAPGVSAVVFKERDAQTRRSFFYMDMTLPLSARENSIRKPTILHRGAPNYYHWLMEDFPALSQILGRAVGSDLNFVLRPPLQSFAAASLNRCGVGLDRINLLTAPVYHFEKMILVSPIATSSGISLRSIDIARETWADIAPHSERKAYYISRSDTVLRRVHNEAAIVEALRPLGVEMITTSQMPIEEQVSRFKSASLVVGPHGAGMINFIFSDTAPMVELSQMRFNCALRNVSGMLGREHFVVFPSSEMEKITTNAWASVAPMAVSYMVFDVDEVVRGVKMALDWAAARHAAGKSSP